MENNVCEKLIESYRLQEKEKRNELLRASLRERASREDLFRRLENDLRRQNVRQFV